MTARIFVQLLVAMTSLIPWINLPIFAQLLNNGYTFSRQQGLSTSSAAKSTSLGGSRVLGGSCGDQIKDWFKQQGNANWANQGCSTEPENVIALPLVPGQAQQFQIIDKTLNFSVGDQNISTSSEAATHQKNVSGFTGFGYSVFVQPN